MHKTKPEPPARSGLSPSLDGQPRPPKASVTLAQGENCYLCIALHRAQHHACNRGAGTVEG